MKKAIIFAMCSLALSLIVISSTPLMADAEGIGSKGTSAQMSNDAVISEAVRTNLEDDSVMTSTNIDVFTREGTVTLTGEVTDSSQVDRAGHIATNTPGVKKVNNQLEVTR